MADHFLPNGDMEIRNWSSNFASQINSAPQDFGLTLEQAAQFQSLSVSFEAALMSALDPASRTRATVAAKNAARAALKANARQLAKIVQANPALTPEQRAQLGLSLRSGGGASTPIGPPTEAPLLQIVHTRGRIVRVQLSRTEGDGRGKAPGAQGAIVFSFVGDRPTVDLSGWTFERATTRKNFDVEIPARVPGGSKVWLAAFWHNPRGQRGPLSMAVSTYVGDGLTTPAALAA